jgi:hypothetical protein
MRAVAAVAGLLVLAALGGLLLWNASRPEADRQAPGGARGGSVSKYPILIPGGDEAVAGHVRWRLIGARLDPHRDGSGVSDETLELRVSLRATEFMNIDTQITSDTVRLLVGGKQLAAQKPFHARLYASQSADLSDLVFLVPASSTIASLQLGPIDGASALLALKLPR